MVVAALVVRSGLYRDQEGGRGAVRLTCATELTDACRSIADRAGTRRIDLTLEPAGTTADRLAGADDPGLDGWLGPEPWPDMVDIRRRTKALEPLFASPRTPLARSPLTLVVWKDRADALASRCGGPVTWRCVGDAVAAGAWTASGGRPEWGAPKPGPTDPDQGVGLLVLGEAVANWFGRTDLSSADLDDDAFSGWFSALERAPSSAPSATASATSTLALMLTAGPAVYDAVGDSEAVAAPLVAGSARRNQLDLLYPSAMSPDGPPSTVDVVLATTGTAEKADAARRVAGGGDARRALAASGWRVEGQPRAAGVTDSPPLPRATNLPPAGLLDALRGRWHEVTGQ